MRVGSRLVFVAVFLAALTAHAAYGAYNQDMPGPCTSAPSGDSLSGTPGQQRCYVPADSTRPTAVQAANVSTDASGMWSVTWARPLMSATPVVSPLPVNTGSLPVLCNVASRTNTTASGRCWQSSSTTLPGTLTMLGGLVVSPFASPAAVNTSVMVIAREPTQ